MCQNLKGGNLRMAGVGGTGWGGNWAFILFLILILLVFGMTCFI
jgi:hypothetical protein